MSLRLLIDEDTQAKLLVILLRRAGHEILTVKEAGLEGQPDSIVFNYAIRENWVLITHNCDDFEELHQFNSNHPGILAIYRDDDPTKNISFKSIVKAIANLELTGIPLAGQFIPLNPWNY